MTGQTHAHILAIRFAGGFAAIEEVLAICGVPVQSPHWRRHAANLLTVRTRRQRADAAARLRDHPAVDRLFDLGTARLTAQWPDGEPDPIRLSNGVAFDRSRPVVIAGPCSVETAEQLEATATLVAEHGADALRGGVHKPRSSPYDFGGLGREGLRLMARVGRDAGLPICTEVLERAEIADVAAQADILQVGTRNMHNSTLLFALGAHPGGRPVLLKRGFGATVDEFLDAAEYFLLGRLSAGHGAPGLILCERGIRTFETSTRFTLDVGAIAALRRRTHLPVVVDPSHPAGARDLVAPLARAGLAAGASGLLVEVHPDPDRAWCDGPQSLTTDGFRELMQAIGRASRGPSALTRPMTAASE